MILNDSQIVSKWSPNAPAVRHRNQRKVHWCSPGATLTWMSSTLCSARATRTWTKSHLLFSRCDTNINESSIFVFSRCGTNMNERSVFVFPRCDTTMNISYWYNWIWGDGGSVGMHGCVPSSTREKPGKPGKPPKPTQAGKPQKTYQNLWKPLKTKKTYKNIENLRKLKKTTETKKKKHNPHKNHPNPISVCKRAQNFSTRRFKSIPNHFCWNNKSIRKT